MLGRGEQRVGCWLVLAQTPVLGRIGALCCPCLKGKWAGGPGGVVQVRAKELDFPRRVGGVPGAGASLPPDKQILNVYRYICINTVWAGVGVVCKSQGRKGFGRV